jgi:hypothetical protein
VPAVWGENWPAVQLFIKVGSQWRAGMGGAYALDHTTVLMHMQRMKLSDEDHDALFSDVQEMEHVALDVMNEQRQEGN